jgi:lysyl-tRNA synthetase class 1
MLLLLKRFVGARALDVTDIPAYMNEFDYLEDVYFGVKKPKDEKELAKLKGLYSYCFAMDVPRKSSVHVPYNLMAFIAKMAPKGTEEAFTAEKLQSYGYLRKDQALDDGLRKRAEYATNWTRDFEEIRETVTSLSGEEKAAVGELVDLLKIEEDADRVQNAIFNIAKKHSLQVGSFFRILYMILLGASQGPRLGPYLLAMGRQNVIDALSRVLNQS